MFDFNFHLSDSSISLRQYEEQYAFMHFLTIMMLQYSCKYEHS